MKHQAKCRDYSLWDDNVWCTEIDFEFSAMDVEIIYQCYRDKGRWGNEYHYWK